MQLLSRLLLDPPLDMMTAPPFDEPLPLEELELEVVVVVIVEVDPDDIPLDPPFELGTHKEPLNIYWSMQAMHLPVSRL